MKYYVYTHATLTGIVFYIGKGTGNRFRQSDYTHRSKDWQSIAKDGFIPKILKDNLTESEALTLETELISNPKPEWQLVNKKLPDRVKHIDFELFKEFFYYDETSPSGLRWAKNKGSRAKIHSIAGTLTNKGYYKVKLNGIPYQIHRIIWVLHYENLSIDKVINHIDGNKTNNKIDNLETCTVAENNTKQLQHTSNILRKDNSTGIRGVSIVQMGKNRYYTAYRTINRTTYTKNFNITKYGECRALALCLEFLEQINLKANNNV